MFLYESERFKQQEIIQTAQGMFRYFLHQRKNSEEASIMYNFALSEINKYIRLNKVDEYLAAMQGFDDEDIYTITDYIKDNYWNTHRMPLIVTVTGDEIIKDGKVLIKILPEIDDLYTSLLELYFRMDEPFTYEFYAVADDVKVEGKNHYNMVAVISLKDEVKELNQRDAEELMNKFYPLGTKDDNFNKLCLFSDAEYVPIALNYEQEMQLSRQINQYLKKKEEELSSPKTDNEKAMKILNPENLKEVLNEINMKLLFAGVDCRKKINDIETAGETAYKTIKAYERLKAAYIDVCKRCGELEDRGVNTDELKDLIKALENEDDNHDLYN